MSPFPFLKPKDKKIGKKSLIPKVCFEKIAMICIGIIYFFDS